MRYNRRIEPQKARKISVKTQISQRSQKNQILFGFSCLCQIVFVRFVLQSKTQINMARTLAATVRKLETKLRRKRAKEAKKRAKEALRKKAASLRKQLYGG